MNDIGGYMLIEYINKAMSKAVYEKLEDGTYLGKIPQCPGVIAFAETLYECQEEVRSVLEGWLIVKWRHGDKLSYPHAMCHVCSPL
jgi:predicted RNase H-like HicB family nuclease